MRTFWIEEGNDSPYVILDESKKLVEITGNSTLKEAHWFYSNLLKWMIGFNSGINRTETVNIKLNRINDSSAKWITLIFGRFIKLFPNTPLEINWEIRSKNARVKEVALVFKNQIGYRVNMSA